MPILIDPLCSYQDQPHHGWGFFPNRQGSSESGGAPIPWREFSAGRGDVLRAWFSAWIPNLEGNYLSPGFISITIGYGQDTHCLGLECEAREPLVMGRRMFLRVAYPYDVTGFQAACRKASRWYAEAQHFVQHALGLKEPEIRRAFTSILGKEQAQAARPDTRLDTSAEALARDVAWFTGQLDDHGPPRLDVDCLHRALLWLQDHGYVATHHEGPLLMWHSVEWLSGSAVGPLVSPMLSV